VIDTIGGPDPPPPWVGVGDGVGDGLVVGVGLGDGLLVGVGVGDGLGEGEPLPLQVVPLMAKVVGAVLVPL
jgi:hypothetical protein